MPSKINLRQTAKDYIIAKKDVQKVIGLVDNIYNSARNNYVIDIVNRLEWTQKILDILTGKDGGE